MTAGALRGRTLPVYHLRPAHGWLNDPNGMTFHDGRWHVFFQHNPEGPVHHRIQWGHASSTDLLAWTEHPVAFGPQKGGPDEYGCWTGVFVPGLDRPAVAYSGLADESLESTVCLRWGSPDLMTWGDPVVVGHTPRDVGVRVMRDPFVFTSGGRRWALLGAGLDDGSPAVLLFSCDDVLDWTFVEVWLGHGDAVLREHAPADIWECPQLVTVGDTAVLVLSLQLDGVLGDVVAATGRLDTEDGVPRLRVESAGVLDGGSSFYAPQLVQDAPEPLMIGWVREDAQPEDGLPVSGCLTLPRRVGVEDGAVRVRADASVSALVGDEVAVVGEGVHALADPLHVEVLTGAGVLATDGAPDVALAAGSTVWVDAEVVEVYPGDRSVPVTVRRPGGWSLRLAAGASARISAVALPTPG